MQDAAAVVAPDYSAYILTPPAPDTPRINGPRVYGERRKAPFLFRIPTTGVRPMTFSAKGLPRGLKLDKEKGIIYGRAKARKGTYKVQVTATNALGSDSRELRIVIGDRIVLTPPLGWNSWNVWGNTISQDIVLETARAFEEKGLADYGWTYVNIDDGWQGLRGGKYNAIQPNGKFPDMKALGDSLHARGLKFGIYSGPWISTYASHIGSSCDNADGTYWWAEQGLIDEYCKADRSKVDKESIRSFGKYSFAAADAKQWADWGVDYLKYDWNPNDEWWIRDMREALDATGRDIVYSLSNSSRVTIGPVLMKYADCWRTTGDIRDNWKSMSSIGFEGQDRWAGWREPGRWPDADMLVLGKVGWGRKMRWTELTPWEQYTHITLWSILASPMLLGCDMSALDPFTVSLLCNNEVLDVHQDPLGIQGVRIASGEGHVTYVKPLEDGTVAVALFNLSEEERVLGFTPFKLGLYGEQTVRDLWRQQDVGKVNKKERWEVSVPAHGAALYRLSPGVTAEKLEGLYRN
ncbi:MAG: putative Ig domain-containing protein [Bacteroidales bacterium]|nr:putative Ig domain-containing protein [Bacteroidales bacterium]